MSQTVRVGHLNRIKPHSLFPGILMTALFAAVLLYQNCGTPSVNNPLYDRTEVASCLGPTCGVDASYINIYVGNPDPILVTRNTERAIDLAGFCDAGGFAASKLYLELKTGATKVSGPTNMGPVCDANGRFRVLLNLPGDYNYNLAYTAVVTFRGVDSKGVEYDHPKGTNRREIAILTAP